jgi:hypothetical protein
MKISVANIWAILRYISPPIIFVMFFYIKFYHNETPIWHIAYPLILVFGFFVLIIAIAKKLLLYLAIRRMKEKNKFNKAPVIYLRSFETEYQGTKLNLDFKNMTFGEKKKIPGTECNSKDVGNVVTDFLRVIGPVKALAHPKYRARISFTPRPEYLAVANDQWQQKILEWLPEAALIVVQLDASPGLTWELQQLALRVNPIRLLLILPPTQDEYDRIRDETRPFFPKPLPVDLPESRLMTFRPDWQPWPLLTDKSIFPNWQTLEPVFEQNGYEPPPWRRFDLSPIWWRFD